jgi:hypothetical protein
MVTEGLVVLLPDEGLVVLLPVGELQPAKSSTIIEREKLFHVLTPKTVNQEVDDFLK